MRVLALILVVSAAARADQNDLELWRLQRTGDPACSACGTDAGPAAQVRFHRLASTLGLAFAPAFQETAGTLGQSGFELGVSSQQVFIDLPADAWATSGTQGNGAPPKVLLVPTLALRKGLGGSLELGAAVTWLANSQMIGLSGEARWALVDGASYVPDFALRAWVTRVVGARDLDLTSGGADAALSKSFGVAGMVKLQPYAQAGIAMVNAFSGAIDFSPSAAQPAAGSYSFGAFRPVSFWNNRFFRAALGLRLVAGAVVLAAEGGLAQGTNAVQDSVPAGASEPDQFVRIWSAAARLGFSY